MPTASLFSSESNTLREHVHRLTAIGTTRHWVVSCYLKLEPRDRSRGKYLIKLKNRVRARLEWLQDQEPDRMARDVVARDCARIREYLEQAGQLPPSRGVAMFACEPLELFEVVPLPRVFRSRLSIDRSPLVRELAALDDEFGLVLAAVYDRTEARFYRVTAGGAEELDGVTADVPARTGRFQGRDGITRHAGNVGVPGEHNYHRRIKEEKQRHYAEVADRLFALQRAMPARGIVLGGVGAEAEAVGPHLHPYLRKLLLGTVKLNPKTLSESAVLEAVLDVRQLSERRWELDHLDELREGLATGWAVTGVAATLRALAQGQVRVLLVDPTAARSGVRCRESGHLALSAEECGATGDPEIVPDVVDEAIEEALRQGSHVDVLEAPEVRSQVDELGALLRFVM